MTVAERGLRFPDDPPPPARRDGLRGRFGRPRPGVVKRASRSFTVTFIAVVVVAAFLSPLLRSFTISLKNPDQINELNGPVYPASAVIFNYQGQDDDVFEVPIDGTVRDLAIVKKGRTSSEFVDPNNSAAGTITWQGSWRRS